MKSNYIKQQGINDKVAEIDEIYRSNENSAVQLAVYRGVAAAYKIIYENYVKPYLESDSEEDKDSKLSELIKHIEMHYESAKKVQEAKEEAEQ